jgi:hypothetical protein
MISMILFFSIITTLYFFFFYDESHFILPKISHHYDDFSISNTYMLNATEELLQKFVANLVNATEEVEFYIVVEE